MAEEYNPFGWFEVPVTDLDRAVAFYENVLGIEMEVHEAAGQRMAWFPMRPGARGAAGALVMGDETHAPSIAGVVVYLTCPDIEGALERVEPNGGLVMIPKTDIGEYGFVGFMRDSEGNRIGLHSRQ